MGKNGRAPSHSLGKWVDQGYILSKKYLREALICMFNCYVLRDTGPGDEDKDLCGLCLWRIHSSRQ